MACRKYFPFISDDSTCTRSIAALFLFEVIVAIVSLVIIIVVLWLWCRSWEPPDDSHKECELLETSSPTPTTASTSVNTGYGNILLQTSAESIPGASVLSTDGDIVLEDTSPQGGLYVADGNVQDAAVYECIMLKDMAAASYEDVVIQGMATYEAVMIQDSLDRGLPYEDSYTVMNNNDENGQYQYM